MGSLQRPVICPAAVRAKQAGNYIFPVTGPLLKDRVLKSELWGSKSMGGGCKTKVGLIYRQLNARSCNTVQCSLSSSSDGNGSKAENFNVNDEDYVNSTVVEAGTVMF